MQKLLLSYLLIFFTITTFSQTKTYNQELLLSVKSLPKISFVSGREEQAALFIKSLFTKGTLEKDKLGNLILQLGSGLPKRLFAAPLDEPGYVISQIMDDGYLRMTPVGRGLIPSSFPNNLSAVAAFETKSAGKFERAVPGNWSGIKAEYPSGCFINFAIAILV